MSLSTGALSGIADAGRKSEKPLIAEPAARMLRGLLRIPTVDSTCCLLYVCGPFLIKEVK